MKKIIVLLSILLLSVTGCSIKRLDDKNIEKNIDIILSDNVKNTNINLEGYKYHVPMGLTFLQKEQYNSILLDKNKNKYYLYVDVISYYHNIKNTFSKNEDSYLSKKLDYNNKTGFIEINAVKDKYFIEYVFNYGKMEALVDKSDLISVINNMSFVLNSIKYNNKILDSLVGENILSYTEENFSLFDKKVEKDDFLKVVSKYDKDYKEIDDQENIDIFKE